MDRCVPLLTLSLLLLPSCGLGLTYTVPTDTGARPDSEDSGGGDNGGGGNGGGGNGGETDTDTDTDADTDTDTDTDADTIRVDSVEPAYGTTAGGESVVITGGPFDTTATVRFGTTAATVTQSSSSRLTVTAPPQSAEGAVDVTVTLSSGDRGELTSGYYYFLDGTGLGGTMGSMEWYHYNGGYWSGSTTDFGFVQVSILEPVDYEFWEFYAGSMESCASEYSYAGPDIYYYDFDLPSASLTAPNGANVAMSWSGPLGAWTKDPLTNSDFQQNGSYDLNELSPADFIPFTVPDVIRTPGSFNVTAPAINGTNAPRVSRGITLSWSGGTAGDYMLAALMMTDTSGASFQETVTCVMRDDGSFTVPSTAFVSWPTGRAMYILLGRVETGTGRVSWNNADSRAVGIYWNVGAGITQ